MSRQPSQLEQAIAVTTALTTATREARETLKDMHAVEKRIDAYVDEVNQKITDIPETIEEGIARLIDKSNLLLRERYKKAEEEATRAAIAVVQSRFDEVNNILKAIRNDAMMISSMMPSNAGILNNMTMGAVKRLTDNMSTFGQVSRDGS